MYYRQFQDNNTSYKTFSLLYFLSTYGKEKGNLGHLQPLNGLC